MPSVTEIACPNCEEPLKVPESVFGKKIKCKHCSHPFVVKDPAASGKKPAKPAVAPSKPGGAVKVKKEEPPAPPKPEPKPEASAPYKFEDDDDEMGAKPNPLGVIAEDDIPRCPHCAKELDPPDAKVCLHCGFNNLTREKAQSKKVWAPETGDYINHLGPGVLALVICIALLVLDIVCLLNMRDWMIDSVLMKTEKGPDGKEAFYVKPGAFITLIFAATIMPILKLGRFAFVRLAIENKPAEKELKAK